MPELLTREKFKQLIREIIKEVGSPDIFTHSQKADAIIKSLLARGAKNNRRFRKFASDLKYKAKLADLGVIHIELEPIIAAIRKKNKRMDRLLYEPELGPPEPETPPFKEPIPFGPEDWKRWTDAEREEKKSKYKTFKKKKSS